MPTTSSRRDDLIDAFVELVAQRLKVEPPHSTLDSFIAEQCVYVPGEMVRFVDFCERFYTWLDARGFDVRDWGKHAIIDGLPKRNPYGKHNANQRHLGNLKWVEDCRPRLVAIDGRLKRVSRGGTV